MNLGAKELIEGVKAGDKRLLAKAITLVESKKAEHRIFAEEILKELIPFTGNSTRIGITGVPGAGKSTFIENFGKLAIAKGCSTYNNSEPKPLSSSNLQSSLEKLAFASKAIFFPVCTNF